MLVTASVRTGDAPTDAALLAEIANDPATAHVRPGPLSEDAVGELVAKRLGAEPDRGVPRGLPPHHRRQPAARPPAAERARDRRASSPTPPTPTSCARSARAPCPARVLLRLARLPGEAADRRPRGRRARRERRAARRRRRRRARRGAGRGHDGRARPRRDPAPRAAARLRAPARPRRRLPRACRSASASCCTPAPPACCARPAPSLDQVAGQLMHTPRRGDADGGPAAARGRAWRPSRAAPIDNAVGYLRRALEEPPAAADRARGCCSTSARSRRSTRGPEAARAPARGLRRADRRRACAVRAANALGRALLFTSSPAEGAARGARGRARAAAGAGGRGARRCEAFALMGVPFGALDPAEMRDRRPVPRPRPRHAGREGDGRRGRAGVDAERRPRRRRSSRSALRRARGRRAAASATRTC